MILEIKRSKNQILFTDWVMWILQDRLGEAVLVDPGRTQSSSRREVQRDWKAADPENAAKWRNKFVWILVWSRRSVVRSIFSLNAVPLWFQISCWLIFWCFVNRTQIYLNNEYYRRCWRYSINKIDGAQYIFISYLQVLNQILYNLVILTLV